MGLFQDKGPVAPGAELWRFMGPVNLLNKEPGGVESDQNAPHTALPAREGFYRKIKRDAHGPKGSLSPETLDCNGASVHHGSSV